MDALTIKILIIIFFAANLLEAQGNRVSCGNFNSEYMSEINLLATQKDEDNFVFAEYCIHFDSEYRGHGKNGTWEFVRTEQFMPMPSIKITDIKCIKSYFISTNVGNIDGEIVIGTGYFKEIQSCAANYDCGFDIDKEYKIDDDFKTIFTAVTDSIQALSLTNKILSFKWNMDFTCSGKKLYDLSGIFYVKISGICNEDQLRKIDECPR